MLVKTPGGHKGNCGSYYNKLQVQKVAVWFTCSMISAFLIPGSHLAISFWVETVKKVTEAD